MCILGTGWRQPPTYAQSMGCVFGAASPASGKLGVLGLCDFEARVYPGGACKMWKTRAHFQAVSNTLQQDHKITES